MRTRGGRPGPLPSTSIVLLIFALMAGAGCSDWSGIQEVEFTDPYLQALEPPETGWMQRLGLFRRYAAVDRAFQLEGEGRYQAAAREVDRYLELHPDDVRIRAYYLSLLVRAGASPASVLAEQASRVLEGEPDFVPALLARGRARAALGRPGEAVDDLLAASRCPDVLPEDRAAALADAARYALDHASGLENVGDPGAAEAYATALELPLDSAQEIRALRGRARTAAALGRVAEARQAIGAAIAMAPVDPALRWEAAELARVAGDDPAAADHLETLLRLEGTTRARQAEALERLAAAYERLGRPGTAAGRLEALIRLSAGDRRIADLHSRAAELLVSADRPGEAAVHLEAAATLGMAADRTALLREAARLYAEAGRYDAAVSALNRALATRPTDVALRDQMNRVLNRATGTGASDSESPGARRPRTSGAMAASELTASRRAFAEGYEATGRLREAADLYALIAQAEPVGSKDWTLATERLVVLHGRLGEGRKAADRLMALHHGADHRQESRDGSWALEAAERYAAVRAWPDAAAAYREAARRGAASGVAAARRMGIALAEAGASQEAAAILGAIPGPERTHGDLRYLASLARESGDTTRAVAYLREAVRRAPRAADSAADLRAIGYLELGRDDAAAVRALRGALSLEPDPSVRLDLARAYLRLGEPESARRVIEAVADEGAPPESRLRRLDLLVEIHVDRGDTASAIGALEAAAGIEPSAYRLNRLGFFHELIDNYQRAAEAFARAYEARPSALQAAQAAYAYRRTGDDVRAVEWFRRSIDHGRQHPDSTLAFDAMRREVAALTDRLSAAVYSAFRGGRGAPASPGGGVGQAGIASQGGLQLTYRPLAGRTARGSSVELLGRLFWGYEDGIRIDPDSYQGQIGLRYRPPFLPGSALGLERWIGLGSAGLDTWAARLQLSRLLGRPYPDPGEGAAPYASLYGDGTYLFGDGGGYLVYAEARPGAAIPLGRNLALLPHGTLSVYRQSIAGTTSSYLEGGPGLGLRLRVPRDGRYTQSFRTVELMTQYRWGTLSGAAGSGDPYGELVFTVVIQL